MKKIAVELSWVFFVLVRKAKSRLLCLKRAFMVPKLPRNPDGRVLIHLGCGDVASPEFINVDARPAPHVHYVRDVTDLSVFPDGYADLVYACHVLEHIPRAKLKQTLWEWRRILRVGGVLRISVPGFDKLISLYQACAKDVQSIQAPLMGRRMGYESHRVIFNYEYLSGLLAENGFTDIHEWDPAQVKYHDFEDWASRCVERNGERFPISLNVEAVKWAVGR
ncbi:MAG: methyltransferase domain-containing protein [Phycisphaerales bacterium]|nr:MAG: methyltransferase domain-containing protein [Phycisphaerales bacterium]